MSITFSMVTIELKKKDPLLTNRTLNGSLFSIFKTAFMRAVISIYSVPKHERT